MDKVQRDAWFVREVLPLEAALTRFFERHWRSREDVFDLRQELYAKLYEAASRNGLPLNTKAFAFSAARNLMIDRVRRDQIISIEFVADLESIGTAVDVSASDRQATARLELGRLRSALATLPPRCREVVRLRRIEQLSQKEVAARMGITEDTVERQVGKGIRLLADQIFGRDEAASEKAGGSGRRRRGAS